MFLLLAFDIDLLISSDHLALWVSVLIWHPQASRNCCCRVGQQNFLTICSNQRTYLFRLCVSLSLHPIDSRSILIFQLDGAVRFNTQSISKKLRLPVCKEYKYLHKKEVPICWRTELNSDRWITRWTLSQLSQPISALKLFMFVHFSSTGY